MPGESGSRIEGSHYDEENALREDEEHRYATFVAAQEDARSIVDALRELDDQTFPEEMKKRLADALSVLEEGGKASFANVSEERQRSITDTVRSSATTQRKETVQEFHLSLLRRKERERLTRELQVMQGVWEEALGRLPADSEMVKVTTELASVHDLQNYLSNHERGLAPEEAFFVQTSIEIRKIKAALGKLS